MRYSDAITQSEQQECETRIRNAVKRIGDNRRKLNRQVVLGSEPGADLVVDSGGFYQFGFSPQCSSDAEVYQYILAYEVEIDLLENIADRLEKHIKIK